MTADRAALQRALEHGETEGGHVEFKERLTRGVHLSGGRFESLAAQLKHRLLSGDGEATYVIGVTDDGGINGLGPDAFSETLDILSLLAEEADAGIADVETWGVGEERGEALIGVARIVTGAGRSHDDDHIVVGTAGHVDHGKSTLVGTLLTGDADNGEGATRGVLDVRPHEVERGLSADLSYGVYGFTDGEPLRLAHPTRKAERASIVDQADKLVSFVDTVGHEPWLRTTIRGLVGQKLDYGLLTVAADDGPTRTTREHLGVLLAMELPTLVAITKTDLVSAERVDTVEREVERVLRDAGKSPLPVERYGVEVAVDEIGDTVVPVIRTSAVSKQGIDTLDGVFERLPKVTHTSGAFRMYIDRTYKVTGVGAVASGTVTSGTVSAGDELALGPFSDGTYRSVEVRTIEMHYHRVDEAGPGQIVGIALKGVAEAEIERGMVLVPADHNPPAVREFEAEVMVLNHPTRIGDGYEPVVHLETIGEAATFHPQSGRLLPGDNGRTRVRFKFRPYLIEPGQRFVFREGKSKGVGTVRSVTGVE